MSSFYKIQKTDFHKRKLVNHDDDPVHLDTTILLYILNENLLNYWIKIQLNREFFSTLLWSFI